MVEPFYTSHFKNFNILNIQDFAGQVLKIQLLKCQMLKIQDLAGKLLIQMAKSMIPFQFEPCSVLTNNLNQSTQITSRVIHMKKDHPLRHVQDGVKLAQKYKIHYFPILIIHLVYPPLPPPCKKKVLHKHCFQFSWDLQSFQENLKTILMQNFWRGKQGVFWLM